MRWFSPGSKGTRLASALLALLMLVGGPVFAQPTAAPSRAQAERNVDSGQPAGTAAIDSRPAAPLRPPDVRYEPTEPEVVQIMLRLAAVKPGEIVYDLGCGDGRIVIAAVRDRGARGVCVDIDPQRIAESRDNAKRSGVEDRIRFLNQDLFTTDFADADVVMLFLFPDLNLKLRPRLLAQLRPGTRVVSHWHDMGDWKPDAEERWGNGLTRRKRSIYLWTIPAR